MENNKRKRGGQPGNLNALKHGFYSRKFKLGETADLELIDKPGLENEINMLRVVSRRLFFLSGSCGEPQKLAGILRTLGVTSDRLGNLMKIQHLLTGGNNDVEEALKQALSEIKDEWNLK
jgi:hypothetical protein